MMKRTFTWSMWWLNHNPGNGPKYRWLLQDKCLRLNPILKVESLYDTPILEKEIRNRNADSAYTTLEMGLILESWDDDDAIVSFSMDELLSYLLVQILNPK